MSSARARTLASASPADESTDCLRTGLIALHRRHSCLAYTDVDQVLADCHRLGLASIVLSDTFPDLRIVLQPVRQAV